MECRRTAESIIYFIMDPRNNCFHARLLDAVGQAVIAADPQGKVIYWNRAAQELYGWSAEEAIGRPIMEVTPSEALLEQAEEIMSELMAGRSWTGEFVGRRKDGTTFPALVTDTPAHDEEGNLVAIIGVYTDITERKRMEERLEYQAFHDLLTNLPNRRLFMDRLRQTLRRTERRYERKVALLFMDLDNFKIVNDSLGHELGDKLLGAVVERLRSSLRSEDTLSRLGGDEFTVLIEEVRSPENVGRVAERIVEDLRGPFVIEGRELFVSASIGIALGDARTKSAEELLRDADTAMYQAKEDAADYRMFDTSMYERTLERMELENDLRRALDKGEFSVHYQPKFRLEHQERAEEVEALVRWEHPRRGFMLPEEFIPIAEETGLIISIGGWVMKEACYQAKEWQTRYPSDPPLGVCVNLSAAQVRHPGLLQDVRQALRESGLEPTSLTLEITEGALLKDTELLKRIFGELKALGVRLAIDDFGKEYSSLSYLKRLPVDVLKINGSFVESLGKDSTNTTIVETVISLAHSLDLEVTGERVERAEQLEHLKRMECDFVQGYYLVRPSPSEEVETLLGDQSVY
jgi:diguanylate cyclase (GGDEF)-like protein/PAS domain S-box-containing protein